MPSGKSTIEQIAKVLAYGFIRTCSIQEQEGHFSERYNCKGTEVCDREPGYKDIDTENTDTCNGRLPEAMEYWEHGVVVYIELL